MRSWEPILRNGSWGTILRTGHGGPILRTDPQDEILGTDPQDWTLRTGPQAKQWLKIKSKGTPQNPDTSKNPTRVQKGAEDGEQGKTLPEQDPETFYSREW